MATARKAAPARKAANRTRKQTPAPVAAQMVSGVEVGDGEDGAPVVIDFTGNPELLGAALDGAEAEFTRMSKPAMAALIKWARTTQPKGRFGGVWDRDRYIAPRNIFEQIRTARGALDDDVVGNGADVTESLAFSKVQFVHRDRDQEDAWNQWLRDVGMLRRWKELWRVLYTDSNAVIGVWWGKKTYRARGKTKAGVEKRKTFVDLQVPLAFTMIDTLKVVPVGGLLFGRESLAYCATAIEHERFLDIKRLRKDDPRRKGRTRRPMPPRIAAPNEDGTVQTLEDPIVERLIVGQYAPDGDEVTRFQEMGIDTQRMWLLNDSAVFRHTLTRPPFRPFADVRLKSTFGWLDLKTQLQQMDRAHLVGGTNFLIVVTQGEKGEPAEPEEIENLKGLVQTLATVPVLVGPHTLKVDIVTPKQDHTLERDRYDAIDVRIAARVYQTFVPTGADNEDPLKLGKVIAQGLESRRRELVETFYEQVFKKMVELNDGKLSGDPILLFIPGQISLAFDAAFASFVLEMRSNNEMSRWTSLSQFEFDEDLEMLLREREADEGYDDVFKTQDPNGPPNPANDATKRAAGRTGGRKGGAAPGSGQGKPARNVTKKSD